MVRTMGGAYYEEFVQDKFIAIGYNEILLREINSLRGDMKHHARQLKETVKHHYVDVVLALYQLCTLKDDISYLLPT